jgi:hypothetical protein
MYLSDRHVLAGQPRRRRRCFISGLRFGHVDHVDQAVHMDIWGGLENGPHMVHMVHIPLFEPRG